MSSSGLIFNTVRGSFVDGWGIRTTIFLKGCPLKCKWCCNPEGQSMHAELRILYDECTGCGACTGACPHSALTVADGVIRCDRTLCTGCGDCIAACTPKALDLFGRPWTAQEMFEYIKKDKAYYDASGGGLTIGGGEASLYPEFCVELIDLCHREGIHVAIDTCGYAGTPEQLHALEHADLLLYDIKGIDPARHREDTAADNALIWKNLYHLDALGKEIIVRLPIIPGHNDDEATLAETARRLTKLASLKRADLICYHQFGMSKYRELDKTYPLGDDVAPIPEERQQKLLEFFLSYGLKAQLGG